MENIMKAVELQLSEEEQFFEQVTQQKRNLYGIAYSYSKK